MKSFILLFTLLSFLSSSALVDKKKASRSGKKPNNSLAANCSPATQSSELNINNTRALIQTGGDMWWDFTRSQYEIPKGSGHTALYAGSLWLGGRDISGQLKVAAQRFRSSGQDFWTGPLSVINAEIDPATCVEYDRHFATTRSEVQKFVGWFEAGVDDAANGTSKQAKLYPGYSIPESILKWPAHGRAFAPYNEAHLLAPFIDRDGNGNYDPNQGDYPAYDLNNSSDCKERIVNVFGDQNYWWVFNDKGNVHTETGASSIGMEIRAQAFAFATNDEVNNMTFYNYELVNRSTFTLTDTYFGQWVDPDLGCSTDDVVGCDVQRGLGYAYNGDDDDEDCNGVIGYGKRPPAIGVDFFQGPFQDADGIDNPLTDKYSEAVKNKGIPYKGIGIGYGDGEIDNERFGMRKFLYHNNSRDILGDPGTGVEYYNYLRGVWKDGSRMLYGGNGHRGDSKADRNVQADYMFPGDTDPLGWGTGGRPQKSWVQSDANDRRFIQSAGPFTLEPGAVNNITVGVVWARATNGNNLSSVEELRRADDKTQALFDNCFQIINGPDAPDLTIRELENELILYLNNPILSNNFNQKYLEKDPTLIAPDSVDGRALTKKEKDAYEIYRFQGYMIYQLSDKSVSASDLKNPAKARLIAQVDIRDSVTRIINNPLDKDLGVEVPVLEVNGENKGIRTSFQIKQDAFAEGDAALVNNRAYYFMAVSYAHNPNTTTRPFLGSRKSVTGAIVPVKGIPHKTEVQNGGAKLNAQYGDGVEITRLEGTGNGGNILRLKQSSIDAILAAEDHKAARLTYQKGAGPINIKVTDPLAIKAGNYKVWLTDTASNGDLTDASWIITNNKTKDTIRSQGTIEVGTETNIPELGISVTIGQVENPGEKLSQTLDNGFIHSEIVHANNANQWFTGLQDVDGLTESNWILSGNSATVNNPLSRLDESAYDDWNYYQRVGGSQTNKRGDGLDDLQKFEQIEEGIIAPFRMTAWKSSNGPVPGYLRAEVRYDLQSNVLLGTRHLWLYNNVGIDIDSANIHKLELPADSMNQLNYLHGVNVVITKNKDLWTRCPVFEMRDSINESEGNAIRGQLRDAPSVDKEGNPADTNATGSDNPNDANYIASKGMGWFPGYAIDVETGERLNMAFGEDSYLIQENGRDMLWNPTSTETEGPARDFRGGGKHLIYVFRNNAVEDERMSYSKYSESHLNKVNNQLNLGLLNFDYNKPENRMPHYDAGKWMMDKMEYVRGNLDLLRRRSDTLFHNNAANVFRSAMWVINPMLVEGQELLSSDVTIRIRVRRAYEAYGTGTPLKVGEQLEIGKSYFVNAGPILHIEGTDTTVYERGMTITPKTNTSYTTEYKHGRPGDDTENILIPNDNGGRPLYEFSLDGLAPTFNNNGIAKNALDLIRVVPNPYYAYSKYEANKLDNRVIITNLPKNVTVRIYTINGTLVRTLEKGDDSITFLEWDLKNQKQVPVASGMYIFHVDAPDIGEVVLKWMGVMRPIDLDNF